MCENACVSVCVCVCVRVCVWIWVLRGSSQSWLLRAALLARLLGTEATDGGDGAGEIEWRAGPVFV